MKHVHEESRRLEVEQALAAPTDKERLAAMVEEATRIRGLARDVMATRDHSALSYWRAKGVDHACRLLLEAGGFPSGEEHEKTQAMPVISSDGK